MIRVGDVADLMERFAPSRLAEPWDNVGLLVGDRTAPAERMMTCLTLGPATVAEAVEEAAQLVVTHHPLPFRPLERLTSDAHTGRLLLELIRAGVAVVSPHTAFDSADEGINAQLACGLELLDVGPLVPALESTAPVATASPSREGPTPGSGRCGHVDGTLTLAALAARTKRFLGASIAQVVGDGDRAVARVAVACGSGGSFLGAAHDQGCDALVTGEARFHTCLEAEALGMGLVLAGHYASERFALDWLANYLAVQFPDATVWASRQERDPLRTV